MPTDRYAKAIAEAARKVSLERTAILRAVVIERLAEREKNDG